MTILFFSEIEGDSEIAIWCCTCDAQRLRQLISGACTREKYRDTRMQSATAKSVRCLSTELCMHSQSLGQSVQLAARKEHLKDASSH